MTGVFPPTGAGEHTSTAVDLAGDISRGAAVKVAFEGVGQVDQGEADSEVDQGF